MWLAGIFIVSVAFVLVGCAGPGAPATPPTSPPMTATTVATRIASTPTTTSPATPTPSNAATASPVAGATASPVASSATPTVFQPKVEVVAANLEVPWALSFATRIPGGDGQVRSGQFLFFTERVGRVRWITDGQLQTEPLVTIPVATLAESGLMGLALDPAFEQNGYLYVMYTYQSAATVQNRISRFTFDGAQAGDELVLLDGIPGGTVHDGGRLAFGPDGKLYATTGDARQRDLAQQLDSLAGKILRMNPDGTVPEDNPFPGSLVYSYGHRNPQGLAWQPDTGQLFATEHGPSSPLEPGGCCHDEVNRIEPGQNYGWPIVVGVARDPRFVDPILESGETTWAPGGVAFVQGDLLGPWQGNLFFATLRGTHLHRVVLGGPRQDQVVDQEQLFQGAYGRIRDVVLGPDGALYFSTSNRDGRGSPAPDDDRILRIVR